MNRKTLAIYNFDCLFKHEGLLKVTHSHFYSKCGSISETMQDRVVITTDY